MVLGGIYAERNRCPCRCQSFKTQCQILEHSTDLEQLFRPRGGGAHRGGVEQLDHDGCLLARSRATCLKHLCKAPCWAGSLPSGSRRLLAANRRNEDHADMKRGPSPPRKYVESCKTLHVERCSHFLAWELKMSEQAAKRRQSRQADSGGNLRANCTGRAAEVRCTSSRCEERRCEDGTQWDSRESPYAADAGLRQWSM